MIRLDAAKRIKAANGDAEAIKLINAETEQAITEENKKETDKRIDTAFQYAEAISSTFSALNELSKQQTEQRIAEITAQSNAELEAINQSVASEADKQRQRAALTKRTESKINQEKEQQAKKDKALAIFQIGINTASSILKTAAQLGYPAAIPFQVAAAIIGAAQIAAVAGKNPPKYERGGVVGGRLHTGGGTLIEAERDEYVINRRQSMKHRRELDAINTSSDAFRKLIEQRYVRPALMDYVASNRNKDSKINVNAMLNSKSMEDEIRGLRKDIRNSKGSQYNNQIDSRYKWQ